jgi:predicted protein tyrosine phosphatase
VTTQGKVRLSVCSLAEMPGRASEAERILSLVDPGTRVPHPGGRAEHLVLRFHDVEDDGGGAILPHARHVEDILAFADGVEPGGTLLIHCHAGISRSPAAACIVAASQGGVAAAQAFLEGYGDCMPNASLITLGDKALGLGGALVRLVQAYDAEIARRIEGLRIF